MINASTPEEFFTIPNQGHTPTHDDGLPIDAINCAIERADSVLNIVLSQFNGVSDVQFSEKIIAGALWSIQGNIEQIHKMVNHAFSTMPRE